MKSSIGNVHGHIETPPHSFHMHFQRFEPAGPERLAIHVDVALGAKLQKSTNSYILDENYYNNAWLQFEC